MKAFWDQIANQNVFLNFLIWTDLKQYAVVF